MDDPWGSPWATPDSDHSHGNGQGHESKPPSPNKPQLEPPRPTFAKLPSFSTHSPWGEDEEDGFGDWTSADTGTTTLGNGWGGWAGETGSNASQQQLTPLPRDDALDRTSPIAWPGSIATSPNFNIKPVSRKASSVFRHPSPDPWASEFSLTNAEPIAHTGFAENLHPTRTGIAASAADREDRVRENEDEHKEGHSDGLSPDPISKSIEFEDEDKEPEAHRLSADPGNDASVGERDHETSALPRVSTEHDPEARLPESSTVQSIASRPSSPGSDDSHHDEDRQDSPITSIDEDSRSRLQVPRKSSYKVQELVERFDALAKTTEDVVIVKQERSRSRTPGPDINIDDADSVHSDDNEDENNDEDFADFEDAIASQSRRPSVQEAVTISPERTQASQVQTDNPQAQHVPLPESRPTTSGDHIRGGGLDFRKLVDKFGTIKFDTHLEDVNKLFDNTKLAAVPVMDTDGFVPDYVVNDSFTNISERKTWYRVSRHGTMRRHNMGNDENYKRVAWSESTARIDTIKIVRRWMEEDSFSGRPTLGGSSGKGHGFGWDSGAEPVTLAQVFGKKRLAAHTKFTSAHQLHPPAAATAPSPARTQPSSPSSPQDTQRPHALSGHFGWNTAPSDEGRSLKSPPLIAPPRPSVNMESANTPTGPQIRSIERTARPISMPPPMVAPISIPSTKLEAQGDDDDDEWGDMVMSPAEDKNKSGPAVAFGATRQEIDANPLADAWQLDEALSPTNATPSQAVDAIGTSYTQPTAAHDNNPTTTMFQSDLNGINGNTPDTQSGQHAPPVEDPWGFADFSRFDSAMPPIPEQKAASPKPAASFSLVMSQDQQRTLPWEQDSITPSVAALPPQASKDESEEVMVREILAALPDLSYMLR